MKKTLYIAGISLFSILGIGALVASLKPVSEKGYDYLACDKCRKKNLSEI